MLSLFACLFIAARLAPKGQQQHRPHRCPPVQGPPALDALQRPPPARPFQ
jgi:hypothetical protein